MAGSHRERFEALRAKEFSRLDENGHVYLDYTGSGLYAASQLRQHDAFLEHHVLGNPHSESPASAAATEVVEGTRRRVLDFFKADPAEYEVVFTSNASASLKLVGESYPFDGGSRFTLMQDNHNSVHGIREYAAAHGAAVSYLPLSADLRLDPSAELPPAGTGPSLFAFPAQSNFSGVKHPLELVGRARAAGYERRHRGQIRFAAPTSRACPSTRCSGSPRGWGRCWQGRALWPGSAAPGSPAGRWSTCPCRRRPTSSGWGPRPSRTGP